MTDRIGTCSQCGGPITDETPSIQKHCNRCGAIAVPPGTYGPVVPMQPAPRMPRPSHLTWIEDESDLEPGLRGPGGTSLDWD
jgi:hypothetical protein